MLRSLLRKLAVAATAATIAAGGLGVVGARPAAADDGATAIAAAYSVFGGVRGFLGAPITPVYPTPYKPGLFEHFTGGSIFWSPSTGAQEVHGAIRSDWAALGWENSALGFPVTGEADIPGRAGRFNLFQGGGIYWTPTTGAHEVYGSIGGVWDSLAGPDGLLGLPVTGETSTPAKPGRYNHFQGGSIYWTPSTGAHEVHGAIRADWAALGWENSALGFPTTNETSTPLKPGRYNLFQGGSVYWSPSTGANEVQGAIRGRWAQMGWENSALGFPTTNETSTPAKPGRYNHFQGGSIYWSPSTGAHDVEGAIRDRWAQMGWENSTLGFPTSDPGRAPDGTVLQAFQGGAMVQSPSGSVQAVVDSTGQRALAAAQSQLGVPYQWGGTSPSTGFDCSGLVMWSYKQAGIQLPRTTYQQYDAGRAIPISEIQPGDIVFYYSDISHDGLYAGNGQVIHSPHTGDVVKYSPLYMAPIMKAVRPY